MRTVWSNKNVMLSEVANRVKDFFEGKGFQIKESSLKDGFQIDASAKEFGSLLVAVVKAYVAHDEITIDYYPGGDRRNTSVLHMFGSVLTLFGGGALVLQDLKRKELLEGIEEDFWRNMDSFFDAR